MSTTKPDAKAGRKWNNEPLVLFVEGYSDLMFYAEAMEHIGLFQQCFIQNLDGKGRGKLRDEAALLLKPTNLATIQSVAVILDADNNADGAFCFARKALQDAVDVDVQQVGKWFTAPQVQTRFGVFIVGGADNQVEVESLAWAAWIEKPDNAAFRGCVEEFVNCAAAKGKKLQSIDKVRIGAVLSVLNEDDPRLGPGARANLFDFKAAAFASLLEFLRGMSRIGCKDADGRTP
jgi:hypothetical protein